MGTFCPNTNTGYRAHAAAVLAELPATRRPRRAQARVRATGPELGAWTTLGMAAGIALIAVACAFALTRQGPDVPGSGLLSAVPSDAAFATTVRDALRTMGQFESASEAADLPDPESWAGEFIDDAVVPAASELAAATPPLHLRDPTEAAVAALGRIQLQLDGYETCRGQGGSCHTQRRAFDQAVDDAYRILGDLAFYTFG